MSTVTNAVAQRSNAGNAVIEQYRNIFAEVLPSHIKPETWVRVAQGALRKDDRLAAAAANNPQSLVSALLDAARRGLEPGTEQYYLVAYGSEVQGIPGYQGEIELIYRAGAVSSVIAEVVYTADKFHYQPGMDRPIHEIDWDIDDRGQLRLVYAYAVMKDGSTSRVVVMNRATVMKHKAMSRGSDRADSPWQKWADSMWLKTAVHELQKWVPTSAEYLRDMARAQGEMIRHASKPVSAPPAAPAKQEAQQEPVRVEAERAEVPPVQANGGRLITDAQLRKLHATFADKGLDDRDMRLNYIKETIGREVASSNELTTREASQVIDGLNVLPTLPKDEPAGQS